MSLVSDSWAGLIHLEYNFNPVMMMMVKKLVNHLTCLKNEVLTANIRDASEILCAGPTGKFLHSFSVTNQTHWSAILLFLGYFS